MGRRGAFDPASRGTAGANGEPSGGAGGSGSGRAAPRPHWDAVATRCRRFAAATRAAFRAVVAWWLGSSQDRSDPATSYPQPWGLGAPVPAPGAPAELDGWPLAREVRRLLAELGPTPGDVAAALQEAGVRGVPCRLERSPMAAFLMAVVGADPAVDVLELRRHAVGLSTRGGRSPVTVPFPAAVRDFLSAFDARCYPMLLAETTEHRPER